MKTHKDLDVWKRSVEFVTSVYEITKTFPKDEVYGLTNQIRRAAVSIPSNIAEGAGRNHDKEFIQFLYIALGSCTELETQLIISGNLKYVNSDKLDKMLLELDVLGKMISGLIRAVRKRSD